MADLIEALKIFLKYNNPYAPTHCEHDVLFVNVDPDRVIVKDKEKLEKLGFTAGDEGSEYEYGFYSFRYGSC